MQRILNNFYHYLWAALGAAFYGFPSKHFTVIGVTGTTGKSTTVEMIGAILEKAGYKVALSSSIRFKIAADSQDNLMKQTMPGRSYLQRFLRRALDNGCQYAVIEVSSEGIKQHRHCFINFDVAVLTNLAPEHIEAHNGFENYKGAKKELFNQVASSKKKFIGSREIRKFIIVNGDFPESKEFLHDKISNIQFSSRRSGNLRLKLIGDFWNLNANAAIAVASSQGIAREMAVMALNEIKSVPGRMEEIKQGQDFRVFVDYAHTPDALEAVYGTLSRLKSQNNKLIAVLGAAAGGRDKWKRPEFGRLAAQYCDEIFITNEDPYNELPEKIMRQVAAGIPEDKLLMTKLIIDRREAIRVAVDLAKAGDILVITGKGCEPWMMLEKGHKIPWDDRGIVREILSFKKSA